VIKTLKTGAFNGANIGNLWLNSNEMATIEAGAFNGAKVSSLDLSYNKLSPVPTKASLGLPNSTSLNVDNQNP
jgi:hypothetical protein